MELGYFSKNKYVDKTRNKKVDYFSFYSLKSATEPGSPIKV
ncbi:hypothetical protein B4084_3936 [Bacillus cereus]|nr:hypothetical protein B4084_3936 [Bacillus cereus]